MLETLLIGTLVYLQAGCFLGMRRPHIPESLFDDAGWRWVFLWTIGWPIVTGIYVCDRTVWRRLDV